jgi:protein-disulfide isomerase
MAATSGGKIAAIILVLLVGAAAGFGYFKQNAALTEPDTQTTAAQEAAAKDAQAAAEKPVTPELISATLVINPTDIVLGDNAAPVTIFEYSSLSCPHCAHFHGEVLPTLQKEFITTGKVKLVLRHFPLNPPALKGAVLVECAGQNGQKRENFIKVLFDMQQKWAFDESFLKNLKQIAGVGGIDSATFDSCMADKSLEDRILVVRQEGEAALKINSTPAFYINNVLYEGPRTADGFRTAISDALKAAK